MNALQDINLNNLFCIGTWLIMMSKCIENVTGNICSESKINGLVDNEFILVHLEVFLKEHRIGRMTEWV